MSRVSSNCTYVSYHLRIVEQNTICDAPELIILIFPNEAFWFEAAERERFIIAAATHPLFPHTPPLAILFNSKPRTCVFLQFTTLFLPPLAFTPPLTPLTRIPTTRNYSFDFFLLRASFFRGEIFLRNRHKKEGRREKWCFEGSLRLM